MSLADIAEEPLSIRGVSADSNIRFESAQGIRSFVRRQSRITRAQQRAFTELWSRFGIDANAGCLAPEQIFGRRGPLVLEIGFGDGESLAAMAAADPDTDYLGIEVHRPGIGHLLLRAAQLELVNLRVLCADAVEIVERQLPDASLDRIQIFFPDPWPKARHRKRRLIQPSLIGLLARKTKPAGRLLIATDWEDYAESILADLNAAPEWLNTAADNGFAPRPTQRPPTKFERRGQQLGHAVRDMAFIRRTP